MSDMNTISVTGRLGRDAEIKHLPKGDAVCEFSIAVAGFKKDAPAMWLRCTLFGKRGESVAQYLTKGSRIGVTGRLQVREFDRKDGSKGTSVEIVANGVTLLGSKADAGAQRPAQPRDRDDYNGGGDVASGPAGDDDIPF